jgi:sodium/bile acid cotransporter 7
MEEVNYMKNLLNLSIWFYSGLLIFQTTPCRAGMSNASKKAIVYKMHEDYKKGFSSVEDITPRDAMRLMKTDSLVFVDVRRPAEVSVSKLPNAITSEEFLKDPNKHKNAIIVAYCTISYRSGVFAEEMEKKGIKINNLAGGLLAWVLEGGKIFDTQGETKRIHVYGQKWSYLPKGYEMVMFNFFEKYF